MPQYQIVTLKQMENYVFSKDSNVQKSNNNCKCFGGFSISRILIIQPKDTVITMVFVILLTSWVPPGVWRKGPASTLLSRNHPGIIQELSGIWLDWLGWPGWLGGAEFFDSSSKTLQNSRGIFVESSRIAAPLQRPPIPGQHNNKRRRNRI